MPLAPINFGRPLSDSIKESIVPLVDGFGVPLGICASGKADGTCVVAGDKGAWVRVAKAGEYVAEVYCLLADSKQHRICDLSAEATTEGMIVLMVIMVPLIRSGWPAVPT